jgi:hypothetical protein
MKALKLIAVAALAACFVGCSSGSGSPDGGKGSPSPTTPVTLTISASPPQTQPVQVPQGSGPVTGTVTFPPVTTVPADTSGNLTVSFLSGTTVAFQRALPSQPQSSVRAKDSNATLPGGPYIFEMTVTAPFTFTLASVPKFSLNLGTLGAASPNAAYVIVVENGTSATYQFPTTAQNDVISFPGSVPSLTVTSGDILSFGIALASNVAAAPTIASFTASPTSFAEDGGSVTLAWDVTGATSLSIDNGVGPVTPVTTGTFTPNVTATTTFTLSADNANGTSVATADVCVATGPVTAVITSPTSYTSCTDSFLTSIVLTNGSCQVVTTTVIGFVSTAGTCGFNGPADYTSANAQLPFSVDAGATETVFDLTNGLIGCCVTQPCSIDCTDTLEWTLTTNVGPISAPADPFTINVSGCNLMLCQ